MHVLFHTPLPRTVYKLKTNEFPLTLSTHSKDIKVIAMEK